MSGESTYATECEGGREEGHFLTSTQVTDLICERMAVDGLALRQICQDTRMPARSILLLWPRQRGDFRQNYARAKWVQCQSLADDAGHIADGRADDWIGEKTNGKIVRVFDPENFRRREKQIGALQWRIAKLRPKRYQW